MVNFKLANVLTILLIIVASAGVLAFVLGQIQFDNDAYQSNIEYMFSRLSPSYDYSCDENVYGLSVSLKNNGDKMVQDLQVSVTNELCVGAIPPLPSSLNQNQSIQFYVYTTQENGTLSVTGNNTNLFIRF